MLLRVRAEICATALLVLGPGTPQLNWVVGDVSRFVTGGVCVCQGRKRHSDEKKRCAKKKVGVKEQEREERGRSF